MILGVTTRVGFEACLERSRKVVSPHLKPSFTHSSCYSAKLYNPFRGSTTLLCCGLSTATLKQMYLLSLVIPEKSEIYTNFLWIPDFSGMTESIKKSITQGVIFGTSKKSIYLNYENQRIKYFCKKS